MSDKTNVARYMLDVADASLRDQYEEVQSIRSRSSFLVAANTLTATIFTQIIDDNVATNGLYWLAIVAFVVCNLLSALILLPIGRWPLLKDQELIYDEYILDDSMTERDVFAVLAHKAEASRKTSEGLVLINIAAFAIAVVLFFISNAFWIIFVWNI